MCSIPLRWGHQFHFIPALVSEQQSILLHHHIIMWYSAVKVLPVGTSKNVKKLLKRRVPNLSKYQDISDFITKGVYS